MSVRHSLLAILAQGPCYGYQLRHEFDRRTGATWPLNVGQIYNTLERLERDSLVTRGAADANGHVYWEITARGADEVSEWLTSPVSRGSAARDELTMKMAVAATLPGADAGALLDAQEEEGRRRLDDLRSVRDAQDETGPEGLARAMVVDAMIFTAEAELRWLQHVRVLLQRHPRHALALELTPDRPKRGRPARAAAAAVV